MLLIPPTGVAGLMIGGGRTTGQVETTVDTTPPSSKEKKDAIDFKGERVVAVIPCTTVE